MSDNTSLSPPEAVPMPAVAPLAPPTALRSALAWPVWLALGTALLALLLVGLLWQKLSFTQQELARRSQDSATQAEQARNLAAQTEAQTQELQARLAVAEVKLSEVTLQRSQLEELMLTLSRSRDDTLVQDIESALRLAQQQAQLTGSAQPLLSALQAADQRIARAAQPRLNPVQRALARDIQRIQGAVLTDVPALVQRLDELARQVEQWPLLNDVGPRSAPPAKPVPQPARTTRGGTATAAPTAMPAASGSAWPTWWERIWGDVTRSGRELVRVSRIDHPDAALLAPEQAFFLRENLKLQLLNARLGLLARQTASAQADVRAVEALLTRYFDSTAPSVRGAQAALTQLRAELVPVEPPRPDESLAALAAAAGGR
ncbi:MAG: uroporphyrinogen-III C-methyltransferase [Hydrogenophaga sp.]|uniref:uroporphyrinogen-III C-methyltransferase n=1 Tax=Hydrogenophaga sp. TaxID=1904254 RepID=UPI003D9B527A